MKGMYSRSVLVGAIIGILAVGVSFAAFASTLKINGTATMSGDFNVKFTAASATENKTTTTLTPSTIGSDGVLSFDASVDLKEPGSTSTINYTITNKGTIAADLAVPKITCYSDSGKTASVSCSDADFDIVAGAVSPTSLAASGTATGTVTVSWKSTSNTVPATNTRYFTVTIDASQAS